MDTQELQKVNVCMSWNGESDISFQTGNAERKKVTLETMKVEKKLKSCWVRKSW